MWEFVGGKVELGETKKEALIRECREELAVAEGNTEGGRRIDEYFVADGVHLNTEGNKRLYTLFMTDFPWLENL